MNKNVHSHNRLNELESKAFDEHYKRFCGVYQRQERSKKMTEDIDFRYRLKLLIIKKKISYASLARKADMNHGTLYNYLSGSSQMTAGNLEKLFNILNKL